MATKRRSKKSHPVTDARGTVELAGGAFDQLTHRIHEFHRAISDIPFERLEQAPVANLGSRPTRLVHDNITDGVYASVRAVGGLAFGLASAALKKAERHLDAKTPEAAAGDSTAATPAKLVRDKLLSAVNGAFGDSMAAQRNPLAVKIGFYHHGRPLPLNAEAIATAQLRITPRVAIFLHGLCCDEHSWRMYESQANSVLDPEAVPYGDRLAADLGFTPFYIRYNSGLHISQNGRSVARLIARLDRAYPQPIEEIVLIGHSMGGLIARSACAYAHDERADWTRRVSNLICLGSPHLGAPLEKVVHAGTAVMDAFKLSRPWAALLNLRSLGIKDLRHGYASHVDWRGHDADEPFQNRRSEIPRLPGAHYHFIGSSIGLDEHDWIGKVIGDGLVRMPSSTAHHLADADTAVLYRTHHMRLLNHPVVYRQIAERLMPKSAKRSRKPAKAPRSISGTAVKKTLAEPVRASRIKKPRADR